MRLIRTRMKKRYVQTFSFAIMMYVGGLAVLDRNSFVIEFANLYCVVLLSMMTSMNSCIYM